MGFPFQNPFLYGRVEIVFPFKTLSFKEENIGFPLSKPLPLRNYL
jgi:hypothetical protein